MLRSGKPNKSLNDTRYACSVTTTSLTSKHVAEDSAKGFAAWMQDKV